MQFVQHSCAMLCIAASFLRFAINCRFVQFVQHSCTFCIAAASLIRFVINCRTYKKSALGDKHTALGCLEKSYAFAICILHFHNSIHICMFCEHICLHFAFCIILCIFASMCIHTFQAPKNVNSTHLIASVGSKSMQVRKKSDLSCRTKSDLSCGTKSNLS